MISEKEITDGIREMGYVTCSPKIIEPSYYKLKDGTTICSLVRLEYVMPHNGAQNGVVVSSIQNYVFVPEKDRHPEQYQQFHPSEVPSGVTDEDVEFEMLRESFSVYDLSDGTVMSVKAVVSQIQKTKFFTSHGEPVYQINTNPVFKTTKKQF